MSREHVRLSAPPPSRPPQLTGYPAPSHRHVPIRHPEPGAPYPYPPLHSPLYGPYQLPSPGVDPSDILLQKLTHSMAQIVASHHTQSDNRMTDRFEKMRQTVTSEITSLRQESRGFVAQIAEVLQTSHNIQLARLERLESILGMGPDMKDSKTLLHRFDLLSFAVEEVFERLKDPEANLDAPIYHDMATSPMRRAYSDAAIPPKTPSPEPQNSSMAAGSSSPIDVFSDDSVSTAVNDSISSIFGQKLPELNAPVDQDVDDESSVGNSPRDVPKSNFSAASPVTRSLVPVDWRDQSEQMPSHLSLV
ncbi:hypothetical protein B0H15DRAFT_515556 [Mycena belliarum]|uniref:Uncharacterized protein n=1 Tax=Mycena belliarum TaxID=1033014 RepID=A0AAD6UIW7_9AGAR|nr:hypothetical protein B0H15DRAFT_515556 [Mycena belliae]